MTFGLLPGENSVGNPEAGPATFSIYTHVQTVHPIHVTAVPQAREMSVQNVTAPVTRTSTCCGVLEACYVLYMYMYNVMGTVSRKGSKY